MKMSRRLPNAFCQWCGDNYDEKDHFCIAGRLATRVPKRCAYYTGPILEGEALRKLIELFPEYFKESGLR